MVDHNRLGANEIAEERDIKSQGYDAILLIAHSKRPLKIASVFSPAVSNALQYDPGLKTEVGVIPLSDHPAGRLVYAPICNIDPDYDDVRVIKDAVIKGLKRALLLEAKRILLVVEDFPEFENGLLVGVLAALEVVYTPIQVRERNPSRSVKLERLGVLSHNTDKDVVTIAKILERGRYVARDIAGGDPERMAPIKIQEYVEGLFSKTSIKITVVSDREVLAKEYPLFEAVDRCASVVERHRGRIVFLEYTPPKEATKTLMLVGKGVTYDTGGADVKVSGAMVGMSRDKCGAAAVAGFMHIVDQIKPPQTKVIAALCLVRNSIGSNCYVPDELIMSRSKVAVRMTNTDAEGRVAMADALCKMKEMAVTAVNPHLFTVATLTGHCVLSVGYGYSIAMDNGPARKHGNANKLQEEGAKIGDPYEISTIRKEDFAYHKGRSEEEDATQGNNQPSTRTLRGHQGPAAFLIMASGLDKHGSGSTTPLKYTHLDISGSSCGNYPAPETGAPILSLVHTYLF
ncbi:hypothetical protein PPYR_11154 [Photinus pyralis]|uniref:Cytosol aminopeptidase domain-containing protein n=1 Tax=Photinus pyralis TaxID=7054 RepID=A0A1Y1MLA6_PHOPY|nr:putative aminopeptidase W07G4.4 [Photinus pyralis]KAB0794315.1 hypothetical protein PPYR_11154 [Photinus pyralis]